MQYPTIGPHFFTATILDWEHILTDDTYKDVIIECLQFLVNNKRIHLYGFVIMNNHVHFIWQPLQTFTLTEIQLSFMTFTARAIKAKLNRENPTMFERFRVNKYDRKYQIWKREPLSVELTEASFFTQKLKYIHNNPVRAELIKFAEDYRYSSAAFYDSGIDPFNMLIHYKG